MDQREWDYGARMSRERQAAEPWTPRASEVPDLAESDQKWSSLTDTGSLQPSDEALDWQRRADAWAQQAESDPHQSVEPANRWSDAAATGRPTFPADGVGWRTETAEWRATGARWRQTTEWRSTTGTHVWRSTTEAWQTDGNKSYPAVAETPMAQPAISDTAWSDDASSDARPSWQQYADPSAEPETPSRHQRDRPGSPGESTVPSWQQPSPRTPVESSPSWQQGVEQPSWNSRPSWQRDAIEGSATWTDLTDQRSAAPTGAATWLPDDQRDDGRHLVREDDRAAWRRDPAGGSPSVGRRRAPEPGSPPSGGTGWSSARPEAETGENTDSWARHTDTGGIQLYGDTPAASSWGTGTGFGSRNVNRRDEGRRQAPSAYGESPGYEIPPAAPYEPPPRQPRRDDTSAARALPAGDYDETPRRRYAPEDEQPRYADEAPGGRSRRGHRYADEPDTSRRADTGSFSPPEPRSPRRARAESDETATFSAVPMPAPPPSSAQRSAIPMPAPPPSSAQRSAVPMPAPPPSSAQRSAVPMPAPPPSSAPRSAVPMPTSSAPRGGSSKGRAKYNAGGADWREQTGSWEAEPDTSSWVRDPDTGQWSRSEDDPRILAWRREAARREAMGEGPQALLPPPGEGEAYPSAEQPSTGWRNTAPPQLPPGPTPRSANPYGESTSPTSSVPGRGPYDQPRGYAPTSSVPYSDPYGAAPTSAVPERDPYGEPTSYGGAPTSALPDGRPRGYGDQYGDPRGYGATPTSSGRVPYDEPRDYGSAPASAVPGRDRYDQPRGYGAAPTGPVPGRDAYDEPRGYSAGPTSSMPARDPYGVAPTSSIPGREPYDPSRADGGYGAAPTSSVPGRGSYDQPRGYGSTPTSSGPGRAPYDDDSAPTGVLPRRDYRDDPRNAPRSGSAYGGAPYGGQPALPSAPRSAPGYGSSDAAPTGGPLGYSGPGPVSAPRGPSGYSGAASTPVSSAPTDSPRYSSSAPAGGPQYTSPEEPPRSGRRRADDDEPSGRRGALDPTAYAAEPLSPDTWRPGPSPQDRPAPDDVPPWSRGESTGARPTSTESAQWHLEERRERARGSATYRESGGADWRRDLADQSDLAEGESRRFGTSDYVPFRSSGSAAASGPTNLSSTSTSLISPVLREADLPPSPQRGPASWNGPSGAYERRPVTGAYPTGRKSDLLDPDDEEDDQESGSPLAAVGYTVVWYGVPVVLFVAYMLVVGSGSQGHALGTLAKAAPQFLISLVLSVVVALGLRFVSHSWKAISVGLAAAVVGGGLATVLTSAITGNSLS
ncbi:hypothetical protein [Actinoplanes sp. M2I2]|uniref:hypothetical protein n=1 Tax=Actinoplanes sp. M2I2 TaxID=1734444 RepID=UPI0020208FC8|nr:hypothetical protein [Actinoplanes sp. M2I2]